MLDAIYNGEEALKILLLGTVTPKVYLDYGTYREGQHKRCDGFEKESMQNRYTEKRMCKCFYYRNSKYYKSQKCANCILLEKYRLTGKYKINDYEVPAFYYGEHIGKIDLVISDGTVKYATEVKPDKGNKESLLRMISEILTYTLGYPQKKYQKAIAFFENTEQEKEYKELNDESVIKALIAKADITVFEFIKTNEGLYRICRL